MPPARKQRAKRDLAAVPDLEEELDRLYGLSLDEFTPARNDLAQRLRAAGLREQADEVQALRKPPVSAWAINRLARAERDDVAALARAGERLVEAQQSALAGDRQNFAKARDEHGELLRKLTARAADLLSAEGRPSTQPMRERIGETLRGASLDPAARAEMLEGRLVGDVEAGGFSLFAGIELPAPAKAREDRREGEGRAQAAELKRRVRDAQGEARELRRQADKQSQEAERARGDAERAEQRAAEAERAAAQAEEAVGELERELQNLSGR